MPIEYNGEYNLIFDPLDIYKKNYIEEFTGDIGRQYQILNIDIFEPMHIDKRSYIQEIYGDFKIRQGHFEFGEFQNIGSIQFLKTVYVDEPTSFQNGLLMGMSVRGFTKLENQ